MLRAYHFLLENLQSAEDLIAGNSTPWRVGEIRAYTPVALDAGGGETISELGYHSSPTLWDAFLHADGPIACLVEVSEPISTESDLQAGIVQVSRERRLLATRDLRPDLRMFACDCAKRVLPLYEKEYPGDHRPRQAIKIARDHARGRATAAQLQSAMVSAGSAAEAAPSGSTARCAAMSASGTATDEPQDAAMLAILGASLAADGKNAAAGPERAWQRALFSRTIERRFW